MFKKNDRVIIVNKKAFFPDGYEIGDLATVTKDQISDSIWVTFDKGFVDNEHGVYASQFAFVTTATLQDVVDTILFFAQSLLLPPKAGLGQVWMWKNDEIQQRVVIGIFGHRVWLADFSTLGGDISCFSLGLEQLYNGYKYSHTVSEFAGHQF